MYNCVMIIECWELHFVYRLGVTWQKYRNRECIRLAKQIYNDDNALTIISL